MIIHTLPKLAPDLDFERKNVKDLVDIYGARWVWDNLWDKRTRLVYMVKSLKEIAEDVD